MRRCGDDVDGHGRAVPCACGDLLVSSRALGAADRLTHTRCRAMGLLVAAPGPVTLEVCDVNRDGACNIGDALRLAQCDVGLNSCTFPCTPFVCQ